MGSILSRLTLLERLEFFLEKNTLLRFLYHFRTNKDKLSIGTNKDKYDQTKKTVRPKYRQTNKCTDRQTNRKKKKRKATI